VANYPIVKGLEVSVPNFEVLLQMKKPMFIGLTISERQLEMIRNTRISSMYLGQTSISRTITNSYSSSLKEELAYALDFFKKYKIPVVNVTNKAVEEAAAEIINLYT
jgi:regulator of PEP synthase PpsR (kinase-PPPase family)